MLTLKQVSIPSLVRVKPGALDRIGIYARRHEFKRAVLLHSQDLLPALLDRTKAALNSKGIELKQTFAISAASFEQAETLFKQLPAADVIIGLGGGKALDVAKYVAFLSRL
ncbi:MAG TPA: iron-containing alcohol dehydrogenase, partial [Candidatus Paceibacterota bacterium]|nr:iron-containing alcohol dehydrogenase [Candidatus Paceibacterota bacterium]